MLVPFAFLSIVIYLHVHVRTILSVCTFSTPLYRACPVGDEIKCLN